MRSLTLAMIVAAAVPLTIGVSAAAAQDKPAAQAPAPPAEPSAAPYKYNPDGRRDPFQSLTDVATSAPKAPLKTTGEGLAAMRVDEVAVRGILQARDRYVAMVQGSDKRTYVVHQGDKLADGVVKSVTAEGLVLVQDVSDPKAKEKTREVRKPLRSPEDGKEQ